MSYFDHESGYRPHDESGNKYPSAKEVCERARAERCWNQAATPPQPAIVFINGNEISLAEAAAIVGISEKGVCNNAKYKHCRIRRGVYSRQAIEELLSRRKR